ncbi:MAG: RNA polymerase sigma factor [Saprospiraceae bacterium]|nr:RNA polymerase sigma factor [Saprospiraceae bacterium]
MAKPDQICEQAVFKELFWAYARPLRNFLYYKCGDPDLAEDLVQEAFLRMWAACQKVSYEKAKAFLFRVANNLFLDEIKHRKVVAKFRLNIGKPVQNFTPQEELEENEFRERLEVAIAELPEKSRTVFLLNRVEGLKYREIALLLDISVKAVEKRMHKALIELRKLSDLI